MNLIDRVIIGQTFRVNIAAQGRRPYLTTWQIISIVQWSKVGTRFVWCRRFPCRNRTWSDRPFELSQITGKIGDDLRDYYASFPDKPERPTS